jgi:type IV secretory pathway TraG/TraD family ATPase VirD4
MAYQLASVLNQNFKLDDTSGNASFFTQAGKQLIQGVLMLAKKAAPYDDIAMCHKILATPNLLERLASAKLDQYIRVAFDNFLSAAGSPETAFSIAATASLMFSNFMRPETLAAFCGTTTLPLDVDGRQMVFFKMDPSKRSTVGPLIAATIHLMVNRNIFRPRKKPLVFSGDEIPSLDLIMLADWLNQNRSSGFVGIIGAQALGFLEDTYGEKRVNGILSGCTTQLIFQLNDVQTAEYYSKLLGSEEVRYKQKSRSNGKGGASHSLADHQQTRSLVEIQEFEQFPKGKCVVLNPGYGNQKCQIRIPLLHQIRIPQSDITAMENSAAQWPKIQANLIRKSTARALSDAELERRAMLAEQMLPLSGKRESLVESFSTV